MNPGIYIFGAAVVGYIGGKLVSNITIQHLIKEHKDRITLLISHGELFQKASNEMQANYMKVIDKLTTISHHMMKEHAKAIRAKDEMLRDLQEENEDLLNHLEHDMSDEEDDESESEEKESDAASVAIARAPTKSAAKTAFMFHTKVENLKSYVTEHANELPSDVFDGMIKILYED